MDETNADTQEIFQRQQQGIMQQDYIQDIVAFQSSWEVNDCDVLHLEGNIAQKYKSFALFKYLRQFVLQNTVTQLNVHFSSAGTVSVGDLSINSPKELAEDLGQLGE